MVELDNFKSVLATYKSPLQEVRDSLDLVNKEQRIQELEREMEVPDFWNDPSISQKKMQELKVIFFTIIFTPLIFYHFSSLNHICLLQNRLNFS